MTHEEHLKALSPDERLRYEQNLLRLVTAGRVENLLQDLGLNQADLARRLGDKSPAWVSKLLSGRQNATLDTLAHVAMALGVRWDPTLMPAPREGTPAASDPPVPSWITASSGLFRNITVHGSGYLPAQLGSSEAHWQPTSARAHMFGGGKARRIQATIRETEAVVTPFRYSTSSHN